MNEISLSNENLKVIANLFVKVYGEEYSALIHNSIFSSPNFFVDDKNLFSVFEKIEKMNLSQNQLQIIKKALFDFLEDEATYGLSINADTKDGKGFRINIFPSFDLLFDHIVYHEIGHTIKPHVKNNSQYKLKSGLKLKDKNDNTLFEDLEEVINDYFAQEVRMLAQKEGFQLSRNKNESSFYSYAFPMLEGFIKDNKAEIIKCQMSDDPTLAFEIFGKENLKEIDCAISQLFELAERHKEEFEKLEDKYPTYEERLNFSPVTSLEKIYQRCYKNVNAVTEDLKNYALERD